MIRHTTYQRATPDTPTADDWRRRGACTAVKPEVMFPGTIPADIAAAKAVCEHCPVYRTCLRDIIRHEGARHPDNRHGVVAALTGPERFAVWRQLKRRGAIA
ncbi:WhiB family transcriptional regulator [Streptomyces sp. Je 1-369]|uniref:WhiB family transcriptional regulator n=1 Tax=Streptomyces sp. Je 1-369 TaxID=2966192 RepID=UPI0022864469|nr:WhiB family transcriptional regulator [Streptomyces sp. Je 1-369]WAL93940.1 WhiB family transcriptional regulator [Streptomyces sp. Je 1-369]